MDALPHVRVCWAGPGGGRQAALNCICVTSTHARRAEHSWTHLHICEFVGLDLEVAVKQRLIEFMSLPHMLAKQSTRGRTATYASLMGWIWRWPSSSVLLYLLSPRVHRAENSWTHRHLCEFVGLDLEMAIKQHYFEVLDVVENLFDDIFNGLAKHYSELERVFDSECVLVGGWGGGVRLNVAVGRCMCKVRD